MKGKHALLALLVVILGGGVAYYFIATRKEPQRQPPPVRSELVEVMRVTRQSRPVRVEGRGTVIPAREVALTPQVTGRVVEIGPDLTPGGIFHRGELVLQIDPTDFDLAIDQAQAAVERAQFELQLEEGRGQVARREWELFEEEELPADSAGRSLALREPHLQNARAALQAARSQFEQAQLNRKRTELRAPFDSVVVSENADVGQLVTPQTTVARLVGADVYYVRTTVPVDRLPWINLPAPGSPDASTATVEHVLGEGESVVRQGQVVRLLGDLEEAGRMARLLVAVRDPLQLNEPGDGPPLLLGAYVRVVILGRQVRDVIPIPRRALREGGEVWVMNADDKLEIRPVSVRLREGDEVLIDDGLQEGERVVTSRIASPVAGLRLIEAEDGAPQNLPPPPANAIETTAPAGAAPTGDLPRETEPGAQAAPDVPATDAVAAPKVEQQKAPDAEPVAP